LQRGAFGSVEVASLLSWASKEEPYFGVWTHATFVLTDSRTDSSAEMFAAVMKDNGLATIIGAKTGGDGCGFMVDAPPLVLMNSKLRFRIPNCVRLRADGTNEEQGISPDVVLEPTDGESARVRAERAIRAARGAGEPIAH
jgi:C-terminal processing protease CtpA/Prc